MRIKSNVLHFVLSRDVSTVLATFYCCAPFEGTPDAHVVSFLSSNTLVPGSNNPRLNACSEDSHRKPYVTLLPFDEVLIQRTSLPVLHLTID